MILSEGEHGRRDGHSVSKSGRKRTRPDFEGAIRYVLERLEQELSPSLHYHTLAHTHREVVPAVERLAALEGVDGDDLMLLRTAAYYHDVGYIEQRTNHEDAGARIAAQVLPGFGYGPQQVETVVGMIMATKLPQSPHNLLEELLADADLDALGREDFVSRNQALRDELAAHGVTFTDEVWYHDQIRFLQDHHYWTAAAKALRLAGKEQNLALMETRLKESRSGNGKERDT
jgi:uncharacterized protein